MNPTQSSVSRRIRVIKKETEINSAKRDGRIGFAVP